MAANLTTTRATGVEAAKDSPIDIQRIEGFLGKVKKRAETLRETVNSMRVVTQQEEDAAAAKGREIRSEKESIARDLREIVDPMKAAIAASVAKFEPTIEILADCEVILKKKIADRRDRLRIEAEQKAQKIKDDAARETVTAMNRYVGMCKAAKGRKDMPPLAPAELAMLRLGFIYPSDADQKEKDAIKDSLLAFDTQASESKQLARDAEIKAENARKAAEAEVKAAEERARKATLAAQEAEENERLSKARQAQAIKDAEKAEEVARQARARAAVATTAAETAKEAPKVAKIDMTAASAAPVVTAAPKRVGTQGSVRRIWNKFTIEEKAAVPLEYLDLNETRVREEVMRQVKDQRERGVEENPRIPGIKIERETSVGF